MLAVSQVVVLGVVVAGFAVVVGSDVAVAQRGRGCEKRAGPGESARVLRVGLEVSVDLGPSLGVSKLAGRWLWSLSTTLTLVIVTAGVVSSLRELVA